MASLLNNEITDISPYIIVDCRYPYEYEAGHLQVSIYSTLCLKKRTNFKTV